MKPALLSLTLLLTSAASAHDPYPPPLSSLDRMEFHPYRFLPAYGHASQNPGSPRYFMPGYGYAIPGFGTASASTLAGWPASSNAWRPVSGVGSVYEAPYRFGHLDRFGSGPVPATARPYGSPWYLPGSPTNYGPATYGTGVDLWPAE